MTERGNRRRANVNLRLDREAPPGVVRSVRLRLGPLARASKLTRLACVIQPPLTQSCFTFTDGTEGRTQSDTGEEEGSGRELVVMEFILSLNIVSFVFLF